MVKAKNKRIDLLSYNVRQAYKFNVAENGLMKKKMDRLEGELRRNKFRRQREQAALRTEIRKLETEKKLHEQERLVFDVEYGYPGLQAPNRVYDVDIEDEMRDRLTTHKKTKYLGDTRKAWVKWRYDEGLKSALWNTRKKEHQLLEKKRGYQTHIYPQKDAKSVDLVQDLVGKMREKKGSTAKLCDSLDSDLSLSEPARSLPSKAEMLKAKTESVQTGNVKDGDAADKLSDHQMLRGVGRVKIMKDLNRKEEESLKEKSKMVTLRLAQSLVAPEEGEKKHSGKAGPRTPGEVTSDPGLSRPHIHVVSSEEQLAEIKKKRGVAEKTPLIVLPPQAPRERSFQIEVMIKRIFGDGLREIKRSPLMLNLLHNIVEKWLEMMDFKGANPSETEVLSARRFILEQGKKTGLAQELATVLEDARLGISHSHTLVTNLSQAKSLKTYDVTERAIELAEKQGREMQLAAKHHQSTMLKVIKKHAQNKDDDLVAQCHHALLLHHEKARPVVNKVAFNPEEALATRWLRLTDDTTRQLKILCRARGILDPDKYIFEHQLQSAKQVLEKKMIPPGKRTIHLEKRRSSTNHGLLPTAVRRKESSETSFVMFGNEFVDFEEPVVSSKKLTIQPLACTSRPAWSISSKSM